MMQHFDALIIGAGMGGMSAAARLVAGGKRVLLLEKSGHLGGRCSHRERDGVRVTTGAIMLPMAEHNATREPFDLLGVPFNMIELTGRMRYRLRHGDFDQAKTGGGLRSVIAFAFNGDSAGANKLFDAFVTAMKTLPPDTITFKAWLDGETANTDVKNLFQGFCAALMGTNLHEIPAGEFFRFMRYSSRGSRFGMAPDGNGANMEALAAAIEARGSAILRHTNCHRIVLENGRATGVLAKSADQPESFFAADVVISNTGPARTIELAGGREHFADPAYLERLDASPHEAPIFHISFVTDAPLLNGFDGCMVFGNTRNLIYLEIPSLISPSVSPPGQFLHTAFGAPSDAACADLKAELAHTRAELEENFPGQLAHARFLVNARHSGQSPGMHRWAGHMMPVTTPIANLYNVGDGCTPPGTIGTEGSAGSAREVAKRLLG
jgi:phytoene dehydrogenase-like protein